MTSDLPDQANDSERTATQNIKNKQISNRKIDHIKLSLTPDAINLKKNGFEFFELVPRAFPELDYQEVDLSINLFGKELAAPIIIAGMTGGFEGAEEINKNLAKICQEYKIGFGVGSQRAGIAEPELRYSFKIRDVAPDVLLFGNLGLVQFCKDFEPNKAQEAIEMIEADALAIHVNPAQEICQPEGDTNFKDGAKMLAEICKFTSSPIIIKEVGAGISQEDAELALKSGVAGFDVGGAGGTSWTRIEKLRETKDAFDKELISEHENWVHNWGIPTAFSILEVRKIIPQDMPVIATGGIRTPEEAVKAFILGANAVGIAMPVLKIYLEHGVIGVRKYLDSFITNLKQLIFLLGINKVTKLFTIKKQLIPKEFALDWIKTREITY
ncbi:MAG: type 2 isopentenyl-diphosphate Delta-isomerase [Candidatus Heimdallarchaeota archaeon]|nr:type 2 isopentenyl-diphosphate Delta-isomerase [Candidatus Heimdallarchaeota archaeon]MCK5048849.1 type 2 isopentenyl-diphosphate Delta-isomerase [Candidatus Heimdallarchaeota archaeon]